jgi:FkbM family methyltransferase
MSSKNTTRLRRFKHAVMRSLPFGLRQQIINGSLGYLHESSYASLRARSFRPGGIVDVGAYDGNWALDIARFFPGSPILMVEAQAEKAGRLNAVAQRIGASVEVCLLGSEDGRLVDFYAMGTGSSIYPENSNAPRTKHVLPMATLDAVLFRHPKIAAPLFIKIDAQGAELDILRGATAGLKLAEVVQLEVGLMPYNQGAPTAYDVFDFMRASGFSILELAGAGRKKEGWVQADIIFARSDSSLRSSFFDVL